MSLSDLDPVLTPPKRLACIGAIATGRKVEFSALRELLDLSDSDLSKQLKALVDSGYVESRKTGKAAGRRTWLSITEAGREALDDHAEALRELINPARADIAAGAEASEGLVSQTGTRLLPGS